MVASGRRGHGSRDLKEVREGAKRISGGRTFQAEGTASAEALRCECARCVPGTARRSVQGEHYEREREKERQVTRSERYRKVSRT